MIASRFQRAGKAFQRLQIEEHIYRQSFPRMERKILYTVSSTRDIMYKFYKFMDVKNLTYQVKLDCFQREQPLTSSSDRNMNLPSKRMCLKNEGNYLQIWNPLLYLKYLSTSSTVLSSSCEQFSDQTEIIRRMQFNE